MTRAFVLGTMKTKKAAFVVTHQVVDATSIGSTVVRTVHACSDKDALLETEKLVSRGRTPSIRDVVVRYNTNGIGLAASLGFGELHEGMCGAYADEMVSISVRAA